MISRFAVMGAPVTHSLSPVIHQQFAKQTNMHMRYDRIEIDLTNFEQQVRDFFDNGGVGLNITLPCKERAFRMGEVATARCQEAQAANTLWLRDHQLHVDNTDGVGLIRDLARYGSLKGQRILLLGAGGAAHGVIGPLLAQEPALFTLANRTIVKAQALQLQFPGIHHACDLTSIPGSYDLVVNATSSSLSCQGMRLPDDLFVSARLAYDLAYNLDEPTPFVALAQSKGCPATDGLGMLIEQAAASFCQWHGVQPDTTPVVQWLSSKRSWVAS